MNEAMTVTAAKTMLEAMTKLKNKEITPQEAQGIAMLGKGVIDAVNAEINFIKVTKAMPNNGLFGNELKFIEPDVNEKQMLKLERRIHDDIAEEQKRERMAGSQWP